MKNTDARVDRYIDKSAEFAQPILKYLREIIHQACPEVTETIKWSFPNFDYKGPLCSMAAFKQHCAFSFWKASLMSDPDKIFSASSGNAMGHLGRITSIKDLPPKKVLLKYLKEAVKLNEEGKKVVRKSGSKEKKELIVPEDLIKALKKNKNALPAFENFSYSHKKEYVEWITEAKTEATRNKRIQTAVEWISEGKSRNWKYMKK